MVAYRQPVSRAQVAEIRGVDSEQALHTLERRGLIDVVGDRSRLGPGASSTAPPTCSWRSSVSLPSSDLPPLADHVPPAAVVEVLERPFRPEEPSSDSRS